MNNSSKSKSEILKEIQNKKRVCSLHGLCGKDSNYLNSHHVSHFGLKKLSEQ